MFGSAVALFLFASSTQGTASPSSSAAVAAPAALNLFERDWVLMNWALKLYDADRDILLEPAEAQAAAEAFRKLADTNGDGRVTPEEYRAARASILSQG